MRDIICTKGLKKVIGRLRDVRFLQMGGVLFLRAGAVRYIYIFPIVRLLSQHRGVFSQIHCFAFIHVDNKTSY